MPQPPYRRPRPGEPFNPRRALSDLEAIGMVRGGGDVTVDEGGGGRQVLDQRLKGIPARITGHVTANRYAFAQIDDGHPLNFPDLASQSPIVGDGTTLAAYEVNGRSDARAGDKVWLHPLEYGPTPGSDPPGYGFRAARWNAKGKLDGDLAAGGSATLSVWEWNGTDESDTTENLTVFDWNLPAGVTVVAGTLVEVAWSAGRWYLIPPAGVDVDKGILSGVLNFNSSATVRLWHVVSGTETDTGIDITAYDWLLKTGQSIASGTHVTVRNVAGRWYVDGAQCS